MSIIFSFLDSHLDKVGLLQQFVDTGAILRQNQTPQLFEKMHKIRDRERFNLINFAFSMLNFIQVWAVFERKWEILSFMMSNGLVKGTLLVIGGSALCYWGVAYGIVYLVNRLFQPSQNAQTLLPDGIPLEKRRNIKVSWSRPSDQEFIQAIIVARILMNLTLAYFAVNPYFLLASVALQTGSLIITARWKWFRYDQSFVEPKQIVPVGQNQAGHPIFGLAPAIDSRLKTVKLSYFRPFLPAKGQKNTECIIGCGDDGGALSQSCSQHAAHDQCLVGTIYSGLDRFNDHNLHFWTKFRPRVRTEEQEEGRTVRFVWKIQLSKEVLPSCSGCRNQPGFGEIEVYTEDREKLGTFTKAELEIIEPANNRPIAQPA